MVHKYSKPDRDLSPINDHQRDLDAHNDPCAFRKEVDRTIHVIFHSLCLYDTGLVRDLINGITIPSSISLLTSTTLLVPVMFRPRDQVTRCAALWMQYHRVGPDYLSVKRMDKSRS